MAIAREEVQHVAHLARLSLTEAEVEKFTAQIGGILDYFAQLQELDSELEEVEPMARPIDTANVVRPDGLVPFAARETLLNTAPEREGDFFRVPQILA
ncbi:MAG: Asp-tRNA(Asn)/Glu-tRNA(Gln) amidotransferase subunit GatC [Oscillatoriales cyanobacterium SM2_1_8]|nr:Asp-tRNA(Asn)/Glu-tRNA(Gln) amidotransferase subunit GatC [Oscillatoriales cyanobacterium SM2_1_8]